MLEMKANIGRESGLCFSQSAGVKAAWLSSLKWSSTSPPASRRCHSGPPKPTATVWCHWKSTGRGGRITDLVHVPTLPFSKDLDIIKPQFSHLWQEYGDKLPSISGEPPETKKFKCTWYVFYTFFPSFFCSLLTLRISFPLWLAFSWAK